MQYQLKNSVAKKKEERKKERKKKERKKERKKLVAFLYTKDKEAEREIRETSPFTIATNNIKYLGVTRKNNNQFHMEKQKSQDS